MKRPSAARITGTLLLAIASGAFFGPDPARAADRPLCADVVISPEWKALVAKEPPLLFAEGLRIRRAPKSRIEKFESELALSLALIRSHIVHSGYNALAIAIPEAYSIKTPAVNDGLKCIIDTHRFYPTLEIPDALLENLDKFSDTRERRRLAILGMLKAIKRRAPLSHVERFARMSSETTPEGKFTRALLLAHAKKIKKAYEAMDAYLKIPGRDDFLKRYEDHAHLIAARAAYAIGDYASAVRHYQAVDKSSNHLAEALSEMAWAYLKDEKYPEAIGAAIQLQSGGLRRTFAPEAPMVMAMSLNEVCQFPESVKAVKIFQAQYKSSYEWLKVNSRQDAALFYPLALAFIKRQSTVPDKVAGEWVRTPEFFSRQEELNLFAKQRANIEKFESQAKFLSSQIGTSLLKQAQELRKRVKAAKSLDPLMGDLDRLRTSIDHYVALKRSAPLFRAMAKVTKSREPGRKKSLLSDMNKFDRVRSQEMLVQLNELAENIQLIEAELYSGASKDLVWQNAQNDVKQRAKEFLEQQKANKPTDAWYWGHAEHGLEGAEEVWEDELGSFKVDIVDYCELRDAQRSGKK